MTSCSESIEDYLYAQEKIKKNMEKLKNNCPEKILNFLLKRESNTTIERLVNCTWSDSVDKKLYFKLLKTSCDDL